MKNYIFQKSLKFGFCLVLTLICNYSSAQFHLNKHYESNLSMHLEDWNSWKNDFYVKYNLTDTTYCRAILKIYDQESNKLLFENDSFEELQMLYGIDSISITELFSENLYLYDTLGEYFSVNRAFFGGVFKLKISVVDSNNSPISNDSSVFMVSNTKKSAILKPGNLTGFAPNQASAVFQWTRPSNYSGIIYYKLRIVKLDSLQELDGVNEYDMIHDTIILDSNITNLQSINLRDKINSLPQNTTYAWTVFCYSDLDRNLEIGSNHGMAYPFIFSRTPTNRSNEEAPWGCSDNAGINNGFENGNITGWDGWKGKRIEKKRISRTIEKNTWLKGLPLVKYKLMNQTDPVDMWNIKPVHTNGGNYSVRIAENNIPQSGNGTIDQLTYTFTVTETNKILKFYRATIVQSTHQENTFDAGCSVAVSRKNKGEIKNPIFQLKTDGTIFNPFTTTINPMTSTSTMNIPGPIVTENWTCNTFDLSKFVNETVTFSISSADCLGDIHFAYSYLDFCINDVPNFDLSLTPEQCIGGPVNATISNMVNVSGISYTIGECTQTGNPIGEYFSSSWYNGVFIPTAAVDVAAMYRNLSSNSFECGKYYKITVIGRNRCELTKVLSKIIHINCPGIGLAGPDKCSFNWQQLVQIGAPPILGYNYTWTPTSCLNNSNTAQPTFNPNLCTVLSGTQLTYTVTVTDVNGCVGSDQMTIFSVAPSNFSVDSVLSSDPCKKVIRVTGQNVGICDWYINGIKVYEGNEFAFSPDVKTTISVYTSNPCGSSMQNITVWPINNINGFNTLVLIYPNAIKPTSKSYYAAHFNVWQYGLADKAVPAYNGAIRYELMIGDRWGGLTKVKENNTGNFYNGEIEWDGKINGKIVQDGTYFWYVSMWNCSNINSPNGRRNFLTYSLVLGPKIKFKVLGLYWEREWIPVEIMKNVDIITKVR